MVLSSYSCADSSFWKIVRATIVSQDMLKSAYAINRESFIF